MRGLRERERLPIVARLAKVSPLGRTVVLKVVINNRGIVTGGIGSVSSIAAGRAIVVCSVIVRRISRLKLELDSRRFALARIGIVRLSGILGGVPSGILGTIAVGIFVGFSLGIFRHGLPGQHLCARKRDDSRVTTGQPPGLVRLPMPKIPRITNFASKTPTIANAANPDEAKSKRFAS